MRIKISWRPHEPRLLSLQILERRPKPLEDVPVPGLTGFRSCFPARSRLGLSVTGSVALHLVLILLAVFIGPQFRTGYRDVVAVRVVRRESLTYRLPNVVYVSPVAPRAPRQPKENRGAPEPKPAGGEKTRAVNSSPRRATRAFELPPIRRASESEQTILIPQLPPEAPAKPVDVRLPKVTFWSSWTLSQPRRPEKKFIQPGRDTTPAPPPALIAPPQLQVPNQERDISDIQIAGGAASKKMPALPRAPSTTMPVQMIAPPEITASSDASLDVYQGAPASVVALNMNPDPPRDIVSIPKVNQVGKLPRPKFLTPN